MEDRSWAEGLNQYEFEIQFLRRNPNADVMPLVETYLRPLEIKKVERMTPVHDESYEADDDMARLMKKKALKRNEEVPSTQILECRGCGRVFTANIGRVSHERRCEKFLNKKIGG